MPVFLFGDPIGAESVVLITPPAPSPPTCTRDTLDNIQGVCRITDLGIFELYSPEAARDPEKHKDLGAKSYWHLLKSDFGIKILESMNIKPDTNIDGEQLKLFLEKISSYDNVEHYDTKKFEKEWEKEVAEWTNKYDSIETSQRGHYKVTAGTDPHDHTRQITGYDEPDVGATADEKGVLDFANNHYDMSGVKSTGDENFKITAEEVKGLTMKKAELLAPTFSIGHVKGDLDLEGSRFRTKGSGFGARFVPYSTYNRYDPPPPTNTVIEGSVNAKGLIAPQLQIGTNQHPATFIENNKKADFSGSKLAGAKFRFGHTLNSMKYEEDTLKESKFIFKNADLTSSDMRDQVFYDQADWTSATLVRANFNGVASKGAIFNNANLKGAFLSNTKFKQGKFVQATLQNADLSGADLRSADLTRADLKNANLYRADLRGAKLQEVDLRGVKGLKFADLKDADLQGAIVGPAEYLTLKDKGFDGCCKVMGNCRYINRVTKFTTKGESQCGNYCLATITCEAEHIPPVTFPVFCEAESNGKCPVDPNTCAENEPKHQVFVRQEQQIWGEQLPEVGPVTKPTAKEEEEVRGAVR